MKRNTLTCRNLSTYIHTSVITQVEVNIYRIEYNKLKLLYPAMDDLESYFNL